MYYRQAVQLDPDVEFKAYRKPAKNGIIIITLGPRLVLKGWDGPGDKIRYND